MKERRLTDSQRRRARHVDKDPEDGTCNRCGLPVEDSEQCPPGFWMNARLDARRQVRGGVMVPAGPPAGVRRGSSEQERWK